MVDISINTGGTESWRTRQVGGIDINIRIGLGDDLVGSA